MAQFVYTNTYSNRTKYATYQQISKITIQSDFKYAESLELKLKI